MKTPIRPDQNTLQLVLKINRQIVLWALLILLSGGLNAQEEAHSALLKGPYLGQKPPGMNPEIFARGVISTFAQEGSCSFSADGNLFLFVRAGAEIDGIMIMEQINGVWTEPHLAPFSVGDYDWDFVLAPGENRVYFASGRPLHAGGDPQPYHSIWQTELRQNTWSEPQLLPSVINSGSHDSFPSVTSNGTLYFFSRRAGGLGKSDLYRSKRSNGAYKKVENLGSPINTEYSDLDAFIDPEERYIIFASNRPGGYGEDDFYISFRDDDSWTKPVNMGSKFNSPAHEYIPYVTPDKKYLFFTSNKSGNREIYWVDAQVIDSLKPDP